MDKQTIKDLLYIAVIILLVLALGTLAVNQTLGFYYKSQLLQKPCDLCLSLNPNLTLTTKPYIIGGVENTKPLSYYNLSLK